MLSISIVTYEIDRGEFSSVLMSLNNAISCFSTVYDSIVTVTIIDNADQSLLLKKIIEELTTEFVSYRLISGQGNIGYGRANNLAIKESKAKYHLILNPDVILDDRSLIEGVDYLEMMAKNSKNIICAVSPRATNENEEMQYLCKRYPSVFNFLLRGFAPQFVKRLFSGRLAYYELRDQIKVDTQEVIEDVPLISGCFMLCNSTVLQKVEGFNESFFLHFEDLALSIELRRHGSLSYLPTMKICHFGGNSAKRGLKHIIIFIRSGIKFFNTYGWKIV